ncbi:MAG TPA: RdgB/HAM1 family non-canonical purine NTP pyrophosphatase [Bacteroidales bacterium]|nr:RdgB/HAM1 family non-canonical purine NTP pyrophosphatase [Bacteroidales bacterium]
MENRDDRIKLVFATNNIHKFKEIERVLRGTVLLMNLNDLGFKGDIPEDKDSLEENAAQKAYFIYDKYGINCFSDDTGLEIEALRGEPGVYSARYAGLNCSFGDNLKKVLEKMKGQTNRRASFRTVIALVEQGKLTIFAGEIRGHITEEKRGNLGFGYDPVFMPLGYNKTFAEMSLEEKNMISHRALAIRKLAGYFTGDRL